MALRLLVIDDEAPVLRSIARLFQREHEVVTASDAIKGLEIALNEDFDGILVDMRMPKMGGREFAEKLIAARPETQPKVVLLTGGDATDSTALPAPLIWKPLTPEDVKRLTWWWDGQRSQ